MIKIRIIVSFLCIYLLGCSSANNMGEHCLKLQYFDSTVFENYNLIAFTDKAHNKKYVISDKIDQNTLLDLEYEKIKFLNEYCIDLNKCDTLSTINSSFKIARGNEAIMINNEVIWENNSVVIPLYVSKDIKGLYISKKKKKKTE